MAYSEFRFFSPLADCEMVRVSMADSRMGEFFALVRAEGPGRYSERRNKALEMIETAIRQGLEPGQVLPA